MLHEYGMEFLTYPLIWAYVIAANQRKKTWTAQFCFGEGSGTPLQYSCLENPMDGGAW